MELSSVLIISQIVFTAIIGIYFWGQLRMQRQKKVAVNSDSGRELKKLAALRARSLTEPLSEKVRPQKLDDIIGQRDGIKALKAALCSSNPQHVLIYGPPGIGKTCAARLVLEEAKLQSRSPFGKDAKFIEMDATCIRFDERAIADPLIGSVHDPIYQGAGALGIAGVPQPKSGAVTKAHGGILFLDEIGELHPIQLNKLLKVMEDRKVYFESAYYNPDDTATPPHIHEIFKNGLPADFRLVGATTRQPHEISPAIRSRCLEIFFNSLNPDELKEIAARSSKQSDIFIEQKALQLMADYSANGREVVNLVQLCAGAAMLDERLSIQPSDVLWVAETCRYKLHAQKTLPQTPAVGRVNGLAVSGEGVGMLLEIEASAMPAAKGKGMLTVNGIIEEEEYSTGQRKCRRKSTARSSVENVAAALNRCCDIDCRNYDIFINMPGGVPVDGPSAGAAIALAIYSAVKGICIDHASAITGEISLSGEIRPVGGIRTKVDAALRAGAKRVLIPYDNRHDYSRSAKAVAVRTIAEALQLLSLQSREEAFIENDAAGVRTTA